MTFQGRLDLSGVTSKRVKRYQTIFLEGHTVQWRRGVTRGRPGLKLSYVSIARGALYPKVTEGFKVVPTRYINFT